MYSNSVDNSFLNFYLSFVIRNSIKLSRTIVIIFFIFTIEFNLKDARGERDIFVKKKMKFDTVLRLI